MFFDNLKKAPLILGNISENDLLSPEVCDESIDNIKDVFRMFILALSPNRTNVIKLHVDNYSEFFGSCKVFIWSAEKFKILSKKQA